MKPLIIYPGWLYKEKSYYLTFPEKSINDDKRQLGSKLRKLYLKIDKNAGLHFPTHNNVSWAERLPTSICNVWTLCSTSYI